MTIVQSILALVITVIIDDHSDVTDFKSFHSRETFLDFTLVAPPPFTPLSVHSCRHSKLSALLPPAGEKDLCLFDQGIRGKRAIIL